MRPVFPAQVNCNIARSGDALRDIQWLLSRPIVPALGERQCVNILNSWLVAALVALVCLLGVTAYAEVKNDLRPIACPQGDKGDRKPAATCVP